MKKAILAGVLSAIALFVIVASLGSSKGIIILEGYPNGVAFCENQYKAVVYGSDATVWNDGVATFVVNAGHYGDKQVQQLVNLAHKECAKYKE